MTSLRWSAFALLLLSACQGREQDAVAQKAQPSEAPSFAGPWRFSSESVDMKCNGPKLERDQDPRRRVEFVRDAGGLRLDYETCKIPLVVDGTTAESRDATECPWVDGMTVQVTSVRAELRSADWARIATETQIRGKHPGAPDHVFDCLVTSDGMAARVAPPAPSP